MFRLAKKISCAQLFLYSIFPKYTSFVQKSFADDVIFFAIHSKSICIQIPFALFALADKKQTLFVVFFTVLLHYTN